MKATVSPEAFNVVRVKQTEINRNSEYSFSSFPLFLAMLKCFKEEDFGVKTLAKTSAVRGIRSAILEQYPRLESVIDGIIPKKDPLHLVKGKGDVAFYTFLVVNEQVVFFQDKDKPWLPTLKLLHQYPSMMPKMQVDVGAIKFVLRGANIMAPGLTSPGGAYEAGIAPGTPVQITAEGCTNACAIGIATMGSEDLDKKPTGQAIESIHSLNDGLWKFNKVV